MLVEESKENSNEEADDRYIYDERDSDVESELLAATVMS